MGKAPLGLIASKHFIVMVMLTFMLAFVVETAHAHTRLDHAIQGMAENLSSGFATNTRIAVVSIQSGSDRMSNYLIDGMIDAFVGIGRFAVVSRGDIELALIRGELDFNMSYEVDDNTAQSIGRFLGAQLIATGAFERLGNTYRLRVRVIEVETAVIRATHAESVRGDRLVRYLMGDSDPTRFWSVGVSVGSSFADPWVIGTLQATLALLRNSFARVGLDVGFISNRANVVGYYSIFPFVHYAFFLPFDALPIPFAMGGWHIGAGGGFMIEEYSFSHFTLPSDRNRTFMVDFVTGFNLGNIFDISYTLRTDFAALMQKISVGFTHRFR
ncbi:MAG: hypothetical protein FWB78_03390 [Treponema sp.]|nr:hypothetical protein [Treponema sp.]